MWRPNRSFSIRICSAALCVAPSLLFPRPSAAQSRVEPLNGDESQFAYTGQLTIQVQDTAGEPFFQGANVKLLPMADMAQTLSTFSDPSGHARFTGLPVGKYVVEVTAPGYRTLQAQVLMSTTRKAQNFSFAMVPKAEGAKAKAESASVSPKAVKESDKAARALELNALDEAQRHLDRALSIDPKFADANYLMALLLLRRKEPGRAVGYLQESLKLSPNHTAAQLALGEAQYLSGDYSAAGDSLEKYVTEAPNSPQAAVAQKYMDAVHRVLQARAARGNESVSASNEHSPSSVAESKTRADSAAAGPLPLDLMPRTDINWAPPDVDDERLDLDTNSGCQLNDVLQSASKRVQELVQNVDRYTATENLEHFELSPMGLKILRETRKFSYLVEIHQVGKTDLNVEEYRGGWAPTDIIRGYPAREEFPGNIATVGIPMLALIFHPSLQPRYDFHCEGRGTWQGKAAWVVHFQQRPDRSDSMLVYKVGNHSVNVALKGRAWIDASNSQILAMESDMIRTAPEIRLLRDHQLIQYGPVSFRNNTTQLWLPKSADWYCNISGHRYHRRHTFSQFLLFSVEDKQKISAPPEPVTSENP